MMSGTHYFDFVHGTSMQNSDVHFAVTAKFLKKQWFIKHPIGADESVYL